MSSSSMSSSASRYSSAMSKQRAQLLTSSYASLRFTSSMSVPSFHSNTLHSNTRRNQAHPNCISIPRRHATTYPRSGRNSRGTSYQPQLVSSTGMGLILHSILPLVHSPCRFWTDILLMLSAIGQVISSLITVMVCLVVFFRSLRLRTDTLTRYSSHVL